MKNKTKIGILGYGTMGKAIFQNLSKNSKNKYIFFITSKNTTKIKGTTTIDKPNVLFNKSDIVFICIKPQDFYKLHLIKSKNKKTIFISIMAGVPINRIKEKISSNHIVRTMPNLPLSIGQGMIGWYLNKKYFTNTEINFLKKLFKELGQETFVKNEKMLNAITAISGSGPAYVFLFMNSLIKATEKLNFSKEESKKIVLQTIQGSLDYVKMQKNINLENLIKKVASKKGTTEAALKKIHKKNYEKKWESAIKSSLKRAEELSK